MECDSADAKIEDCLAGREIYIRYDYITAMKATKNDYVQRWK